MRHWDSKGSLHAELPVCEVSTQEVRFAENMAITSGKLTE